LRDEAAGRELEDEGAVHLLVEVELEGVERLADIAEAGLLEPALQEPVLTLQQLVLDEGRETRYRPLDAARFTAVVYRDGTAVSRCTIWMDGGRRFTGGIGYVANDSGNTNSFNESLTVETDGREAYLKPLGMAFIGREPPSGKLSPEAAAEYLWSLFLRPLQEGR